MQHPSNTPVFISHIGSLSQSHESSAVDAAVDRGPSTATRTHLPRRALLSGLPAMGAALVLPKLDAAAFPASNEGCDLPHPVLALPFVREAMEAERAAGAAPRCFWSVEPTGAYGADCGTGGKYARLALDYMVRERTPYLLQWIVFDMMRLGRPHTGIEVGFMSFFGHLASDAWSAGLGRREGELA